MNIIYVYIINVDSCHLEPHLCIIVKEAIHLYYVEDNIAMLSPFHYFGYLSTWRMLNKHIHTTMFHQMVCIYES